MTPPLLSLRGISKFYPGVRALQDVDFECRAGEVHALLGENGAGKSTLLRIIYGATRPDTGSIRIDGQEVVLGSPHEALANGISMVAQELNIVPDLTVADNVVLGHERTRFGLIRRSRAREMAEPHLRAIGYEGSLDTKAATLSTAQRQLVEIARVLYHDHRLVILDEPTASIGFHEANHLLGIVEKMRAEGRSIVFVSHRLSDITRLRPDRITVLRDGALRASYEDDGEVDEERIVRLMVGRNVDMSRRSRTAPEGDSVLEVADLTREPNFRNVSMIVHAGEIVGVAGMVGSGRTELVRAICGLEPTQHGRISVLGAPLRIASMAHAIKAGIVLVPEDRKAQGLVCHMSLVDNICLPNPPTRFGIIERNRQRHLATTKMAQLKVKGEPDRLAGTLSGGNQQKVVLAKWMLADFRLIIFDEPTRGIDIGAKQEIYALIERLADDGRAVIVVSSDLPEVIRLSDRVYVMRNGEIGAELQGDKISEEAIVAVTLGRSAGHPPEHHFTGHSE